MLLLFTTRRKSKERGRETGREEERPERRREAKRRQEREKREEGGRKEEGKIKRGKWAPTYNRDIFNLLLYETAISYLLPVYVLEYEEVGLYHETNPKNQSLISFLISFIKSSTSSKE